MGTNRTVIPFRSPDAKQRCALVADELRRRVDPRALPSERAISKHRTHIIGQDRAIRALQLGLELESPGYNIYLSGPSGSGRMTTAKHILAAYKQPRRPLRDFVYVHHFQEPDRARLLVLTPGEGPRLKKAMDDLAKNIKRELPRTLGSQLCQKERDHLIGEFQKHEREFVAPFQERIRKAKFALVEVQDGLGVERDILPLIGGAPKTMTELEELLSQGKLSPKRLKQLGRRRQLLRKDLEQIERQSRLLARDMNRALEEFERHVGSAVIDTLIEELRGEFQQQEVQDYIDDVREGLLERIPALVRQERDETAQTKAEAPAPPVVGPPEPDPLAPFQVNVILSNARRQGCPLVIDHTPTLVRLFGTIERSLEETMTESDFMNIRAGSLLKANGGFLILKAEDLVMEMGAWKTLKRALSSGLLDVRSPEGPMGLSPSALKPDPIPIDVKIILLGDEDLYRELYLADDDFKKIFKVKAEFDVDMEFSSVNLEKFVAFVERVVTQERLLPPTRPALAALVEEAMRDVEDRERLTTRFRVMADILREASHWARQAGRRRVTPEDLERALAERYQRVNLVDVKYRECIERDVIMVATKGMRVGQVNGLAVFDLGDYSFGKPCRITASVGIGRQGVVNIEREAGLSGETHDKGMYIVGGFLRQRFGRRLPLALEASVCFEQSYDEIDGDSASSAEMYALMSALAEKPLAQGIAVTGSVNQQGDIQPIGGVNQKIEGFFEICHARGLDGTQGVMIPRGNLPNLMLRKDVVEAVAEKRFHIWAISNVDEGLEILTGTRAGAADEDGRFPPGSINGLAATRLEEMAEEMRRHRT